MDGRRTEHGGRTDTRTVVLDDLMDTETWEEADISLNIGKMGLSLVNLAEDIEEELEKGVFKWMKRMDTNACIIAPPTFKIDSLSKDSESTQCFL